MSNLNELLEIMKEHQKADRLVQGHWWENGTGCFYGCAMESDDKPIERACEKFGLPLWIGYWSEKVFEGLPLNDALKFPVELLEKLIAYKGDLEILNHDLAIKRLTRLSENNKGDVKAAIDGVIDCHVNHASIDDAAWSAAWSAAESAAWSAAESARCAAESAARSAARCAARSAARCAAESARCAAESAARSAARSASYQQERDWMYELLNSEG